MGSWWERDIIGSGKLPLMLAFLAFVLTFLTTRAITRLIRAGRGPFKDQATAGGTHVHHAVPGLILLVVGAFLGVANPSLAVRCVAGVLVGVGVSLVLDEFALILHLSDVYWTDEGRLSVNVVMLAAASLGLALAGFSPLGVSTVGTTELAVRIGGIVALLLNALAVLTCVAKGKYAVSLLGVFVPIVAAICAVRFARPGSPWARRFYDAERTTKATARAHAFDARWGPVRDWVQDLIAGAPTEPPAVVPAIRA